MRADPFLIDDFTDRKFCSFGPTVSNISNIVSGIINGGEQIASDVVTGVEGVASDVESGLGAIVSGTVQTGADLIEGNVGAAVDAITNTFTTVYGAIVNAAGQIVSTTNSVITDEINTASAAVNSSANLIGQTVSQAASDIGSFVSQHSQLIETVGEDALIAGMMSVGVPAPLALALGNLAVDLVQNNGQLTAADVGQVLGDAVGGPVGGALTEGVTESIATGKIDLSAFAGAAADAVAPDFGQELNDAVSSSLQSVLGDEVGGGVADELTSVANNAVEQLANTGTIDPKALATGVLADQTQNLSDAATTYAQEQLSNITNAIQSNLPDGTEDAIQQALLAAGAIENSPQLQVIYQNLDALSSLANDSNVGELTSEIISSGSTALSEIGGQVDIGDLLDITNLQLEAPTATISDGIANTPAFIQAVAGETFDFSVPIEITGNLSSNVVVTYTVSSGASTEALLASDFVGGVMPSGTITVGPGGSENFTFEISPLSISSVAGFTIDLTGAAGVDIVQPFISVDFLPDITPDSIAKITALDADQSRAASGVTPFTFLVTRSGNLTAGSIEYTVTGAGGSPAQASDFAGGIPTSQTLNFSVGQASQTVTIDVNGSGATRPPEDFAVTLTAPLDNNTAVTADDVAYGSILGNTFGPLAFFLAPDSNGNVQLYVTDGTVAGTRLLDVPSLSFSPDVNLTGSISGNALTVTAVTSGTIEVGDAFPDIPDAGFITAGGTGNGGIGTYTLSGTTNVASESLLADTVAGDHAFYVVGGNVVFNDQYGVWTTDGTAAGTIELAPTLFDPTQAIILGDELIWANGGSTVNNTTPGLWISNGTPGGTYAFDTAPVDMDYPVVFNNQVVFSDFTAGQGFDGLWVTSGFASKQLSSGLIEKGTSQISVPNLLNAIDLVALGSEVVFFGENTSEQYGLWITNGTPSGTTALNVNGFGSPFNYDTGTAGGIAYEVLGGEEYFEALDQSGTAEIWQTDGTATGTIELSSPFDGLEMPVSLAGAVVSFSTGFSTTLKTLSGEQGIVSQLALPGVYDATALTPIDDNSIGVFLADDNSQTGLDLYQLWVTDGTVSGTHEIVPSGAVGPNFVELYSLDTAGTLVLFVGVDSNGNTGIWASNGTVSGTVEIEHTSATITSISSVIPVTTLDQLVTPGWDTGYAILPARAAPANAFNSTDYSFTVTRTGNTANTSTLDYAVSGSGSNPAQPSEFTNTSGSVVFSAGTATATVTISVAPALLTANQQFTVSLQSTDGQIITTSSAVGTIDTDLNTADDYFGTGTSDILWYNNTTDEVAIWEMSAGSPSSYTTFGTFPSGWQIAGSGDFNGDGDADILWQNQSTNQAAIWLMNGDSATTYATFNGIPSGWVVAGGGDFNGDGDADILWRNPSTTQIAVWQMNGTTPTSETIIGTAPSAWKVGGVADFNGDGDADILWQNTSTGQIAIWEMNGSSVLAYSTIGTAPSGWQIAGVGDFAGNGTEDILFQNTTFNKLAVWQTNGASLTASAIIANNVPFSSGWQIAAIGDYNGSGADSILWQNAATGQAALWQTNGATVTAATIIASGIPAGWTVAHNPVLAA